MEDEPTFGIDRDLPPGPINWNLLDAPAAAIEWRDLDMFVTWLKDTFGLPPAIVPPCWHRHDELIWELSALHTHFLACYDDAASPSVPASLEIGLRERDLVIQLPGRAARAAAIPSSTDLLTASQNLDTVCSARSTVV